MAEGRIIIALDEVMRWRAEWDGGGGGGGGEGGEAAEQLLVIAEA